LGLVLVLASVSPSAQEMARRLEKQSAQELVLQLALV
jgi:hypothetical protein